MSTEAPPDGRERDTARFFVTILLVGTVSLIAACLLLRFMVNDWAKEKFSWYGPAVLAVFVIVICARVVRNLVTPARSRTSKDLVAAGFVVVAGLAVLYFGIARPVLQDRQRDAAFAARIGELRARSEALEAVGRDLPDPASAEPGELGELIRRVRETFQRDVPPAKPVDWDEFARFTAEQRGELLAEMQREVRALKVINERMAALKAAQNAEIEAVLKAANDKIEALKKLSKPK
ncbi:MAG TPA: hypothetical protein VKE40_05670 [Gemmataceae bacterium]|nr:hypothetical protein [Gemmataceae bacterium]